LSRSHGLGRLVLGMLFVVLAKGMLSVVVKAECGWLKHNGKIDNRMEVLLDMYLGAPTLKKMMGIIGSMGVVIEANASCD
jgi:hypothetical protein